MLRVNVLGTLKSFLRPVGKQQPLFLLWRRARWLCGQAGGFNPILPWLLSMRNQRTKALWGFLLFFVEPVIYSCASHKVNPPSLSLSQRGEWSCCGLHIYLSVILGHTATTCDNLQPQISQLCINLLSFMFRGTCFCLFTCCAYVLVRFGNKNPPKKGRRMPQKHTYSTSAYLPGCYALLLFTARPAGCFWSLPLELFFFFFFIRHPAQAHKNFCHTLFFNSIELDYLNAPSHVSSFFLSLSLSLSFFFFLTSYQNSATAAYCITVPAQM